MWQADDVPHTFYGCDPGDGPQPGVPSLIYIYIYICIICLFICGYAGWGYTIYIYIYNIYNIYIYNIYMYIYIYMYAACKKCILYIYIYIYTPIYILVGAQQLTPLHAKCLTKSGEGSRGTGPTWESLASHTSPTTTQEGTREV